MRVHTALIVSLSLAYVVLALLFGLCKMYLLSVAKQKTLMAPFHRGILRNQLVTVLSVEAISGILWVAGVLAYTDPPILITATVSISSTIGWLITTAIAPDLYYASTLQLYTFLSGVAYTLTFAFALKATIDAVSPRATLPIIAIGMHTLHRTVVDMIWACQMSR